MAGKFLTLEEAARRLGISVDEVNRLVDRKALFPMRAGASIKFKAEDVERVAADLGTAGPPSGMGGDLDLGLELELSSPMIDASGGPGAVDLSLGGDTADDESIFSEAVGDRGASASNTVVRAGGEPAASGAFDVDDLALDSLIGASSPAVGGGRAAPDQAGGGESGTLQIDLGDVGDSLAAGSLPGISGVSVSGAAASGGFDSGLSLEGPEGAVSSIDLDTSLTAGASVVASGGSLTVGLPGEAFELGADTDDDESASVVIATEETGDSSFFEAAADDSASVSFDGSSVSVDLIGGSVVAIDDLSLPSPAAAQLSVWQVVGLVCCTLLLSVVVLVVFDVLQTVRAPQGSPVSGPVLEALAKTFGW